LSEAAAPDPGRPRRILGLIPLDAWGLPMDSIPVQCYISPMTKLLRDTLRHIEQLPDSEQDAAAGALLDYLAHRNDLRLSDEQLADIRRRRADPNRKLVSHEDARVRIGRLGA
jgi:hypothetical protein